MASKSGVVDDLESADTTNESTPDTISYEDIPPPDYGNVPPHLLNKWVIEHFRAGDELMMQATNEIYANEDFPRALWNIELALAQYGYVFDQMDVLARYDSLSPNPEVGKQFLRLTKLNYHTCRALQQHLYSLNRGENLGINLHQPVPDYPGTKPPTPDQLAQLTDEQVESAGYQRVIKCGRDMMQLAMFLQQNEEDKATDFAHTLLCELDDIRCYTVAYIRHEGVFDLRFVPNLARLCDHVMSLQVFQRDYRQTTSAPHQFSPKPDPTKLH